MTIEEAIKILEEEAEFLYGGDEPYNKMAFDMAIEALRNCSEKPNGSDLISRQAAIKNAHFPVIDDAGYEVVRVNDILALPSAEPCDKDAISRECLLKSWEELSPRGRTEFDQVIMTIPALPSAEPKPGKWIPVTRVYTTTENDFPYTRCEYVDATEPDEIDAVRCSECGEVFDFYDARNWCTQCGAYMRGEEE